MKVVKRQLRKCGLEVDSIPDSQEKWNRFLSMVNDSYAQYDQDRYLLERSLALSSEEMRERMDELREVSLQLAQANKLSSLGTLASGVAHELNNPLAALVGLVELMSRGNNDEKMKQRLERARKIIDRMAAIVNHLRRLSRKQESADQKKIKIHDPLYEALHLLEKQLVVENVNVNISGLSEGDDVWILGDPVKFESLYQNLITNSYHAFLENSKSKRRISLWNLLPMKNNVP